MKIYNPVRQSEWWWLFEAHPLNYRCVCVCYYGHPAVWSHSLKIACTLIFPENPPVLALSLTFYLDITLACISANVNSEWMCWDVEVNDDALTKVYMKLSEGCLNPQSHFTHTSSLKSILWLGLNLDTDTYSLAVWELQSLHYRFLTTQSFSRLLDPPAFQIVFAKVKCNVQLAGSDGVNGEDERRGGGGWGEQPFGHRLETKSVVVLWKQFFFFVFFFHSHTMK